MATQTLLPLLLLLLLHLAPLCFSVNSASDTTPAATNATDFIRASCNATLYPSRCYASLARYADIIQGSPVQLARFAVAVSLRRARQTSAYMTSLCRSPLAAEDPRAAAAVRDCASTFGDAVDQIEQSQEELRQLKSGEEFRWQMSNVETWMSAALTNEDTCTDGFEELPQGTVKADVASKVARASEVTSNALALVNCLAATETPSRTVNFEMDGGGW